MSVSERPQHAEPAAVRGPCLGRGQAGLDGNLSDLVRAHVRPGEPGAGLAAVPEPDLLAALRGPRRLDLDQLERPVPPPADGRAQAYTLWVRSARFGRRGPEVARLVRAVLEDNPFSTLQVVLEPAGELTPGAVGQEVGPGLRGQVLAACQAAPTYLDKFYALQPGRPNGAKRVVVLLPRGLRGRLPPELREAAEERATLAWRAGTSSRAMTLIATRRRSSSSSASSTTPIPPRPISRMTR